MPQSGTTGTDNKFDTHNKFDAKVLHDPLPSFIANEYAHLLVSCSEPWSASHVLFFAYSVGTHKS
jgi:hypothetical protein